MQVRDPIAIRRIQQTKHRMGLPRPDVMVERRRAEVKVSTLSAEQTNVSRRQGTQHVGQMFCGRGGITSRDLFVCVDENARDCDVQG